MNLIKKGLLAISLFVSANAFSVILVPLNSEWKYVKGTADPVGSTNEWTTVGYNDAAWLTGNAPFWYASSFSVDGGTNLTDMRYNYTSVFLRKKFTITQHDSMLTGVSLRFGYDDGFRLWINGKLVLEKFPPQTFNYNDSATGTIGTYNLDTVVNINLANSGIKSGENVVAVAAYNKAIGSSSDFYFNLSVDVQMVQPSLPKGPDVTFSKPGGYYDSNFNLILTSPNVGDTIIYTLDCSDPKISSTVLSGKSPVTIAVNPASTSNRPATPAFVVRATVKKSGFSIANSETRTYIFINQVKTQSYPGAPWPNYNVNGQYIDYDVDSKVINDARYANLFGPALKSIPTVSLVTDNENLFSPDSGIYVNAMNRGADWEYPASLELIDSTNVFQFSSNMGLRIRGGWSRHPENAKHAFRVFFRNEYGKKSLDYPIYGSIGAPKFDKFDLRCAQNYSWSYYDNPVMTYVQDEYCRDAQGMMGQPYTRSRYCQLFLNGMYWGLYEFQERPEANFASSYVGGDKDNFDVIKMAPDIGGIEATDGTLDKWQQVYNLTNLGFSGNVNYYKLQGLNSQGAVDTTIEALVDIDNLIDYMMNIFYSGNFDAPVSEFGGNNYPNNFYCIKNRKEKREGFIFIVHDAEHTFNYIEGSEQGNNGGVYENRVTLPEMQQPAFSRFHPQWLHQRLTANAEYRMKFADKAYKYLFNNGLFTPDVVEKNFRARANQIDLAIIGESARWGDSRYGNLNTKDDSWVPAIENTVSEFIAYRTDIVISQLQEADLLPNFYPPVVKKDNARLDIQQYNLNAPINITLTNPNSGGTIYYTLDGSDPRNTGGGLNAAANTLTSGATINIPYALKLKARVKNGTTWSPVRELLFTNKTNRENIHITELQYHPIAYGSSGDKDLEFIEFKNTGSFGVDLGGVKLDSAVNVTFPLGTIINPNGFVVAASDKDGFEMLYKRKPTIEFKGSLNNAGERLMMIDESNAVLLDMDYEPTYPWPIQADGTGYSLVPKVANPTGNPALTTYWKYSFKKYGSPFADDEYDDAIEDVIITSNDIVAYPNPVTDKLIVKWSGNKKISNIEMVDISGRLMFSRNVYYQNNLVIPVKTLAIRPGLYIIRFKGNEELQTIKVLVK